jgi:hypothetical protein
MIDENKLVYDIVNDFPKETLSKNDEMLICDILYTIDEQPKIENTENFNHFKLFSDSTLKSMTKDELIEYIHDIYHNWKSCDYVYNNAIDENYRLYNQLVELSRVLKSKDEYITELRNYITQIEREFKDNPPLKFEELKENMVVWDNKRKMFIKIFDTATLEENCFSFEVFGWEVPIYDEQFEENRFYRREVKK